MVSDKYVAAVVQGAGGVPVLLPALGEASVAALDHLDGLLLTGSPSNIEPHLYDGPAPPADNQIDPARDATTLPMIHAALARGLPVLGICRGMQELNVALGGTLHQEIHKIEGRLDHRSDREGTQDHRYRKVHPVSLTAGGVLSGLSGCDALFVNSLHGQGIDRLADGLSVEAVAPDGQIEAVTMRSAGFVLAVQWHPEWSVADDQASAAIFAAFGEACREYRRRGKMHTQAIPVAAE